VRYLKPEWLGTKPSDKELFDYLRWFLGTFGAVRAGIRVTGGVVQCENDWLHEVRGALALKWQFRSELSGTKKGLEK
jgi:hypothetical protein